MPVTDEVQYECKEGAAWITFNRPARKNALTPEMMDGLATVLERLAHDPTVRVVVLRGAGTDFCSGADVNGMAKLLALAPDERAARFHRTLDERIVPLLHAFERLTQPILCSIRGYAIGIGAQFALLSDLVIASETAQFVFPQVRLGHTLDHGESWYLPRRIGAARAAQVCLLGEPVGAADAERFGLANWVLPDAQLDDRAAKLVVKLLRTAPEALWRTKALLKISSGNNLQEQLAAERMHVAVGAASNDYLEAMKALQEKRAPRFCGT
jgi:2-(1,2-epoxy-1,2-dihydrophenyl)acetyl-CoA isomerase